MPFDPVNTRRNRSAGSGPEEPVMMSLNRSGESGMTIRLRLSAELLAKLRWVANDRIQICEGTGEDAGKLQLERVTRGGVKLAVREEEGKTGLPGILQLRLAALRHHIAGEVSEPPRAVTHGIEGSALVVGAPVWLRPVKPAGLLEL